MVWTRVAPIYPLRSPRFARNGWMDFGVYPGRLSESANPGLRDATPLVFSVWCAARGNILGDAAVPRPFQNDHFLIARKNNFVFVWVRQYGR